MKTVIVLRQNKKIRQFRFALLQSLYMITWGESISPGYSTSSLPQAHWTSPLEEEGLGPLTSPAHSPLQEALTVPKLSPLDLYGNTEQRHHIRKINGSNFCLSSWPGNIKSLTLPSASHFVVKWESLLTPTQGTKSIKWRKEMKEYELYENTGSVQYHNPVCSVTERHHKNVLNPWKCLQETITLNIAVLDEKHQNQLSPM